MLKATYPQTFYYFANNRDVLWGWHINVNKPTQVEKTEFTSEEAAYKDYVKYLDENPQVRADSPINLPKGSDIFVDFDGTIYRGPLGAHPNEMPAPDPIVVRTLQQLHAAGYRISLYSCRSNPGVLGSSGRAQQLTQYMEQYCAMHQIPYSNVEAFKPHYHLFIEDRAVNGTDWTKVREHLGMTTFREEEATDTLNAPHEWLGPQL